MHAATEVDRMALLDVVDVADTGEDGVDLLHAVDAECGNDDQQQQDQAESRIKPCADFGALHIRLIHSFMKMSKFFITMMLTFGNKS
ncbi:hypothetical protein D3C81_1701880 [compost metagenome]